MVKRKEEIEVIEAWLNNPQVSTVGINQAKTLGIKGLGGVGKSTLAAYFYDDPESEFKSLNFEKKFWADVSAKPDFTVFAEKIILALGGKPPQRIDITELINNLLLLLSQRRCLLVVDNLETLLDRERKCQDESYQEFFRRWLQQGTNSTLLITTQEKPKLFQGLDYWHTLGGMKIEEGIALLNKLAIQGTEAELKDFVEKVNGHPLTIKLVAGYLREYCDCQLNQFDFDDKKVEKVDGLHRDNQDACLDWIIKQHLKRLSREQKQFITNLSVYRLPFNLKAARKQIPEPNLLNKLLNKLFSLRKKVETQEINNQIDVREPLQELCNRSLLTKTKDNKYQFESLVQKYVLQQANTLTNAHQQAIEYYKANLKEPKSWQVLEDVSEYLEIVDHQCELGQYASANKFLNSCYGFLNLRGYYGVSVEIYEKLVPGWRLKLQPEDKSDYAVSLNNLGSAYNSWGKYPRAIEFYQQSLKIAQKIGNRYQVANSLIGLGSACTSQGKYPRAIEFYQQSLKIAQKIGNRYQVAVSLIGLGNAYNSWGKYQRAIEIYQQSLEIAQKIGNRYEEANSLNNLGNAYYSQGKYPRAKNYLQQSLKIFQEIGARHEEANSLNNLGNAYYSQGKYPRAKNYLQQSLKIFQEIGARHEEANSLCNLGNVYRSPEEYPRAIDYYQKSLKIFQEIGARHGEAKSLCNLGNTYYSQEEYPRAIDYLEQSLEIFQEIGTLDLEAKSWFNLGDTRKNLQQKSEAKTAYENSRELYQEMGLDKKVEKCDQAIQDLVNNDLD
ncbi:conserved hypothetical protein [Hyella patelloides LEGE 07179]|uniref:NB-ARC domain-containing protein n=1 Tax=Hyella patelloides LEGE 07179 TaxID=945734 RepID=A0A563VUX0_9CYAN|nr:tetratricopeptide repeat protein [Hyella patelloides]VEP15274.1 conserved hypothetical protein [Hyella patelloides LEGE 07179]